MLANLSNKDIVNLWQTTIHNKKSISLYYIVNQYLLTKKLNEDYQYKHAMKVLKVSKKDSFSFIINYINRLTSILFKSSNKLQSGIILYRGETRKHFNYKVNDIITYNTFHSATSKIEIGVGFTQNFEHTNHKRVLFCIKYDAGAYCKKMTIGMTYYTSSSRVTTSVNEFEYLLPPVSHYCITEITKIGTDILCVKMRCLEQKHLLLTLDTFYNDEPTAKKCKNFEDRTIQKYENILNASAKKFRQIVKMKKYHISEPLYDVLQMGKNGSIFTLDLKKVNKLFSKLDAKYDPHQSKNVIQIIKKIKKVGMEILPSVTSEFDYNFFYTRMKSINNLDINKFKSISMTCYSGYCNVDQNIKPYHFVTMINTNDVMTYDKIILAQLDASCFLYECDEISEPHVVLSKDNKKILQFYQHIIKLNLHDVKIAVHSNPKYMYQSNIIILPPFRYELNKKTKSVNKLGHVIYHYDIELYN
jgi:hypothetical protein